MWCLIIIEVAFSLTIMINSLTYVTMFIKVLLLSSNTTSSNATSLNSRYIVLCSKMSGRGRASGGHPRCGRGRRRAVADE